MVKEIAVGRHLQHAEFFKAAQNVPNGTRTIGLDGRLDLLWWAPGTTDHAADFGTAGNTVTPGPPVLP